MNHRKAWPGLLARTLLALAVTSCTAPVDDSEPQVENQKSELTLGDQQIGQVTFPCGTQIGTAYRCQVADIADVGPNDFVTAHIDASGNLRYAYYNADNTTFATVAPFVKGTEARWIRANTSKSWSWQNKVSLCYENYFAVQVTDSQLGGHGVYLDRHVKCGTGWRPMTRTFIAATPNGPRAAPSVAAKGTARDGDVMVIWLDGILNGRILRLRTTGTGGGLTPAFAINYDAQAIPNFSTDLIYHQQTNRWVATPMSQGGFDARIYNVVLSSSPDALPAVLSSTKVGFSGESGDGHHTSVAYNPLSWDGTYVHWRQNDSAVKAVYIEDSNGIPLPNPANPPFPLTPFYPSAGLPTIPVPADLPQGSSGVTVPVASTFSSNIPYVFLLANKIWGLRFDRRWMVLDEYLIKGAPLAVRSLPGHTIGLTAQNTVGVPGPQPLRLFVSDYPSSTLLATPPIGSQQRVFYTDAEILHQKWKTSTAGNGTWSAPALVNQPWHAAKDMTVAEDCVGTMELFYIGADDVLYRTRQAFWGANEFDGERLLTPGGAKARRVAVQRSNDGRLVVVYARYPDDVLYQTWQTQPCGDTWTAEQPLVAGPDNKARLITPVRNTDGKLEVIYTSPSSHVLFHTVQTALDGNSWSAPLPLNASTDTATSMAVAFEPAPASRHRLVYLTRSDGINQLYETWQTAPGVWNGQRMFSNRFEQDVKDVALARNDDGRLAVFLIWQSSMQLEYALQSSAGSAGWGPTSFLGNNDALIAKRVAASLNTDGRLEVYYVGMDDVIYHTSQTQPSGTSWYASQPL